MWYMIGAIWIALLAGIVWAYRRKNARRAAESASRLNRLLAEARPDGDRAGSPPAATPAPVLPAAPVPQLARKQRLLAQADALLYFLLRTGLPDHEVFANLALGDVLELAPTVQGYERERQLRRLAQQRLDFVICTRQLEVVAAVTVDRGGVPDAAQAGSARFTEESLRAAGIRVVRIDASAPPRHQQVRALIYGADEQNGSSRAALSPPEPSSR